MSANKTTLAIFDFDGTLTEGHLWLGIARHHKAKKIRRTAVYCYIFSHMPYWLAAKMRLYPEDKNRAKWGQDLSVLFKGFSVYQAQETFNWICDNYFMELMRPDVLAVMREHRQKGDYIILLSGMFTEFLEVIGKRLEVDAVIGTNLEKVNQNYTGKIIPPLCFGDNKANYLQGFLKKKGINAELSESYAYADSYYDNPVFGMVGHPVAVYPDKKLQAQAIQRGWPVIGKQAE